MVPHSILITQPALSIDSLALACSQLFEHKVTEGVDQSIRKLHDAEKFLSIVSAMRDPGSKASLKPDLLKHVTFSVMTVAEEQDMLLILDICSGMSTTLAETRVRGIMAVVITGTLSQWRDCILAGCNRRVTFEVCSGFNQLHSLFVSIGLGSIWKGYKQTDNTPGLFHLTHE